MKNILTLVLGGGSGTRLFPLTKYRSKPAVPLAGKYRLIDIPLSNCINSGLNRIYVLTQFHSVSLHRHIRRSYNFDAFTSGFVEILAAQQTLEGSDWYQGTADAVRQNLRYIEQPGIDYVLILSGDQLYRMNYLDLLKSHHETGADVSICALPVPRSAVGALGVMRVDNDGRVVGFLEKPQTDEEIDLVRVDPAWIDARGIPSKGRDCLANMGVYLFNRQTLVDVLTKTNYQDFGKEVFPASFRSRHVQAHLFDGFWEDIGTIRSYYETNLSLAASEPPFDLFSSEATIYSRSRFLPPSRFNGAMIQRSLIADGCVIDSGATIENSVIGLRCRIGKGAVIRDSVVMGADDYQSPAEIEADLVKRRPPIGIGENAVIEGAIIDKNCRIGNGVRIYNRRGIQSSAETELGMICDSIVVVPKESTLPDGVDVESYLLANADS